VGHGGVGGETPNYPRKQVLTPELEKSHHTKEFSCSLTPFLLLNLQGDSGSPLICNGVLHGLVSSGAVKCASKKNPAVFMEICKFRKWIEETMAENDTKAPAQG
uniref:Peptidase S1 domain-containing protein n=1 Tax=Podarcis muralis TaxID=64176 RepID=A0A670JK26_PODMU